MNDDFIARMIKHSESSDSPLLKLLIEQVQQSKNPREMEDDEPRDRSPPGAENAKSYQLGHSSAHG